MPLRVLQQNQQRSEEPSNSWRKRNIRAMNKRHSSAPPTRGMTARDGSQQRRLSFNDAHHESAAMPSVANATSSAPATAGSGHPLTFPSPKFSPGVKEVEGESFTIVSVATGRRWLVVNSSRDCQFGEVLRAVELAEDSAAPMAYFAVKELSRVKLQEVEGQTHENPRREVAALQYLSDGGHPNLLTCTEALFDKDNFYIVTPFYSEGGVFDTLIDRGRVKEDEARPIFRQVLDLLLYLKSHGVCHGKVSLENLMFAENNVVKLVGFGLALRIPQKADGSAMILPPQGARGKLPYMSPEVLASSSGFDGFAVDVWACGVMLFIMLTGVYPFELALPSRDQWCQLIAVEERLDELLSAWDLPLSPDAISLIQSCLRLDPGRRPSLETLLTDPWFTA